MPSRRPPSYGVSHTLHTRSPAECRRLGDSAHGAARHTDNCNGKKGAGSGTNDRQVDLHERRNRERQRNEHEHGAEQECRVEEPDHRIAPTLSTGGRSRMSGSARPPAGSVASRQARAQWREARTREVLRPSAAAVGGGQGTR